MVVAFDCGDRTNLSSSVGVAFLSFRVCRLVLCFLDMVHKCPALSRGRYPTVADDAVDCRAHLTTSVSPQGRPGL